jgi:hypothetical protein
MCLGGTLDMAVQQRRLRLIENIIKALFNLLLINSHLALTRKLLGYVWGSCQNPEDENCEGGTHLMQTYM